MASTDAGTPAAGNGQPPPEPTPRRGLRDSALGKLLLLGLVLGAAFVATRSCASTDQNISSEEAIEIAKENASFEPCPEVQCAQSRYIPRGIPPRGYWGVVLSEDLDADGAPTRFENFLVDAITGEVSRP
jgi:predicted small secreted protein